MLWILTILFSFPLWADCVSECAAKPGRSGNACFREMCQKSCVLAEKQKKDSNNIRFSDNGDTVYMSGKIEEYAADFMAFDFDSIPREMQKTYREKLSKVKFVVLNSPGGDIKAARHFIDWIRSRGDTLKVIVPQGGICASTCAEIFRCAKHRVADRSALIMYHPTSLGGPLKGPEEQAKLEKHNRESESQSCAVEAAQSEGGRKISEGLKKGLETCYRVEELKGYVEVEGGPAPASGPNPTSEVQR